MLSRLVLLGVAVFALVAALALLISLLWWRGRFVATRITLAVLLIAVIACPLGVFLSLGVYQSLAGPPYVPPKILNQAAPLPDSTRIYIPTWSPRPGGVNTIQAVNGHTGAIAWRATLPATPNVNPMFTWPPVAADGILYLAQVTTWQIHAPSSDVRSTIYALRFSDGTLARTYTLDGAINWLAISPGSQAPGVLYFKTGTAPFQPISFGALDLTSGQVLWRQMTSTDLVAGPAALYAHLLDDGSGANVLMALEPRTGAPLWRTPVDVPEYMSLLTDGERVYAMDTDGHVMAVRASDGKALWHTYFGGSATSLNLFVDGFALAGGNLYLAAHLPGSIGDAHGHLINPEAVYALDRATGTVRWTYRTASGNRGTLAAGGDTVYIRTDDGLHAIRAADGTRLWLQADLQTEGYRWGVGTGDGPAGPLWNAPLEVAGSVVFDARFDAIPPSADHPGGCSAPCQVRENLYALDASTGVAYWRVPIGPAQKVAPHWG